MKILYLLLSTVYCFQIKPIIKPNLKLYSSPNNKLNDYLDLIRYENILPTTLLNLSGGWIMNPSIDLFLNKPFLISIINTLLIMSSSMILNDIYDIDIDKINNPTRPLVSGKISMNEAKILVVCLLGLTEILSNSFLDTNLNLIIQLSIINVIIYTPIFKKITFVKNISCASLVAFSPIFSGLAANINNNYNLLYILSGMIFIGSLFCEILLDICDKNGDEENNIITIPIKYGDDITLKITCIILIINIIFIFTSITYNYDVEHGIILPIIFSNIFNDLNNIKESNYSNSLIRKTTMNTNLYLFVSLIYLYSLSK